MVSSFVHYFTHATTNWKPESAWSSMRGSAEAMGVNASISSDSQKTRLSLGHIYLLTSSLSQEREKYFRPVLDQINLDYEVCHGLSAPDKVLKDKVEEIKRWSSSTNDQHKVVAVEESELVGRVGCTLGHRAMWQSMVDNNYDTALFLEDDIDVVLDLEAQFTSAFATIPDDWAAIYLGYCAPYWTETRSNVPPDDGRQWHTLKRAVCGHAYVLKKQTAEILLNATRFTSPEFMQVPWDVHMGHLIFIRTIYKAYGFAPVLVTQRPRSSLHPSLINKIGGKLETSDIDVVEKDWRYHGKFPKNCSAAFRAGVSYWHSLDT